MTTDTTTIKIQDEATETENTFGLPEEEQTEIPLVETNPPASPKNETTAPLLPSDANTIDMH